MNDYLTPWECCNIVGFIIKFLSSQKIPKHALCSLSKLADLKKRKEYTLIYSFGYHIQKKAWENYTFHLHCTSIVGHLLTSTRLNSEFILSTFIISFCFSTQNLADLLYYTRTFKCFEGFWSIMSTLSQCLEMNMRIQYFS